MTRPPPLSEGLEPPLVAHPLLYWFFKSSWFLVEKELELTWFLRRGVNPRTRTKTSHWSGGNKHHSKLGNSRKYPYPTTDGFHVLSPPCLRKFQNALPPPMPSEFHNREPPLPFRISVFLDVHFQLSNAYMNKRTWIYASSRLWSSGARRQAFRL